MMRRLSTVAKAAALTFMLAAMAGHSLPAQAGAAKDSKTSEAQANARAVFDRFFAKRQAGASARAAIAGRPAKHSATAAIGTGRGAGKARRSRYDAIIAKHAAAHGVPLALAHAVIRVESNYRANARGGAGEVGLMQIKPATARALGYAGSAKGLYNPETNLRYGMKYLGEAHRLGGGEVCGTILKYNAGHGAKRMNKVSAAYCAKVKRHLGKTAQLTP